MINKLHLWLRPIDRIFGDYRKYVVGDKDKRRIFIDRGADVLFVAHLDTVQKPKYKRIRKNKKKQAKRIYASGLDDRLGCLIAFELSKQLGADLLLTDLEEQCQSTAQYHQCKDYNWIAEFDRGGGDVVTYDLDGPEFIQALEKHFIVGFGSYSDICSLQTDACCVNVGIGYELAHSRDSYVVVKTMKDQIDRFLRFYTENKDQKFKRDMNGFWLNDNQDDFGVCELCGFAVGEDVYGVLVCEDCFHNLLMNARVYG